MQIGEHQSSLKNVHKISTHLSRLIEIDREFKVPVRKLFEAFKTADALKAWWWPQGLYADRADINFHEGGKYFINMKGSTQGGGGGITGQFDEIVENKRIVMSDQFADQNGNAITAKEANMPGVWPEIAYITLEFSQVDENSSRLHLSQEGVPNDSQKECMQGWNEMFDKLEDYLTKSKTDSF